MAYRGSAVSISTASVLVNVVPQRVVVASIVGGDSRDFFRGSGFSLDASGSFDEDQKSCGAVVLSFAWSCRHQLSRGHRRTHRHRTVRVAAAGPV